MPWEVITALVVAAAALAKAFWPQRTESKTETVDGGVLEQFLHLASKVSELEGQVASLRAELADRIKVEEYLRGALYEKDKEVTRLRIRVAELEEEVGANGR